MPARGNPAKQEQRACKVCATPFTCPVSRPVNYCSPACRERWRAICNPTTECPTCGTAFTYNRSWPRKYCSNVCKGKANVGNIARFAPSAFVTTCEQCGNEFETTPKSTRGRFCSLTCYGHWMSANLIGAAHPKHGKKVGRHKYLPPPSVLTCPICDKPFVVKPREVTRRRCCSLKCYAEWMADNGTITGPNNPNWAGGEQPGYYGPNWRPVQRAVRERDQVCLGCGVGPDELGRELDVHHLTPFRNFGIERYEEANDLANLVALCPACHKRWEHSGRRP